MCPSRTAAPVTYSMCSVASTRRSVELHARMDRRYLLIICTKKFMNIRDEYPMIHLSLAVIVLEFPSPSDPPPPRPPLPI